MPLTHVGELVTTGRAKLGISQEELAQQIGTTRAYISQIENGSRQWPRKYIPALSEALGVSPAEFQRAHRRDMLDRQIHRDTGRFPYPEPRIGGIDELNKQLEESLDSLFTKLQWAPELTKKRIMYQIVELTESLWSRQMVDDETVPHDALRHLHALMRTLKQEIRDAEKRQEEP